MPYIKITFPEERKLIEYYEIYWKLQELGLEDQGMLPNRNFMNISYKDKIPPAVKNYLDSLKQDGKEVEYIN